MLARKINNNKNHTQKYNLFFFCTRLKIKRTQKVIKKYLVRFFLFNLHSILDDFLREKNKIVKTI
jgi:hypothetical protein